MKIYSAINNAFYAPEFRVDYEASGTWPTDGVEVTESVYDQLQLDLSKGKVLSSENGQPVAITPPQPVVSIQSLLIGVANKRWVVETGGIVVDGRRVDTDRESQAQLNNSYSSLKLGLIEDTQWKDADGNFTLVTLVELEPIAQAVAQHVRACFVAEQVHNELIGGLTTQEQLDEYDINEGWPSNG